MTEPTHQPFGVDATLRALLADILGLGDERAAALHGSVVVNVFDRELALLRMRQEI